MKVKKSVNSMGKWIFIIIIVMTSAAVIYISSEIRRNEVRNRSSFASTGTNAVCEAWPNKKKRSLQDEVFVNKCVMVKKGTHKLSKTLYIPQGNTIKGESKTETILLAAENSATFKSNLNAALIEPLQESTKPMTVSDITIDGNKQVAYGIGHKQTTITNTVIRNATCNGIGIVGEGMTVSSSTIEENGFSCPNFPPGAGIYVQAKSESAPVDRFAPVIKDNIIRKNMGPGIDVNRVVGGRIENNQFSENGDWAAISIYGGSEWTIHNNIIRHPISTMAHPYHPECAGGPIGNKSAAIILCQNTGDLGSFVTKTVITKNSVSSGYGILLIGNDESQPYFTPRHNTIKENNVFGSEYGCADDFKPNQWFTDTNTWEKNNCSGGTNQDLPGYF